MEWDFTRNPLAISVMLLIAGVNIGLAISMALNSGDVVTLLALDGRSVLIPAILQVVLVLIAYLACRRDGNSLAA